jgi:hypothetical protein
MMLRANGIGVADWPTPFRFAHPDSLAMARTFEPFISRLLPDTAAWEALFDEEQRLRTFRAVYGNRKGKRRAPRLFEVA